jgi:hypothetical protein
MKRTYAIRWPRRAGKKPTIREIRLVQRLNLATDGTQNAVVAAMLLRKEGVSQPQIIAATGSPHRNKLKQLASKVKLSVKRQGRVKVFHGYVNN